MIGDIGGFNSAIIILPTFLMAIYSERMYQGSIQEEMPTRKPKKKREYEQPSPLQANLQTGEPIEKLS